MKTFTLIIVLALVIAGLVLSGPVGAARPIPPSNETSSLYLEIDASATGRLSSSSDLAFTQGNGDLSNSPPLDDNGEGVANIGYVEHTTATSGSIEYHKTVSLDTSSQMSPSNNLETTRSIDYTNTGDGAPGGRMVSSEAVVVSEYSTGALNDGACCPPTWGGNSEVISATCVNVEAGSKVDLKEGSVDSESSARTVSDTTNENIEMTYEVDVEGSAQTQNQTAVGSATVYVDVTEKEGSGTEYNQTTDVDYRESVTVSGLIEIALETGYSAGG